MAAESGKRRAKWGSKAQFLLACIGYAVGLGNIWRFPYLCYVSGGGAFLIPYFVTLIFLGVPLLYMEMAIGQLTRLGPIHAIAKLCPLLKGTGVAMTILSFLLCTYYNVIIAWALYYFFNSFSNPLPWKYCGNPWNDVACISGHENMSSTSLADEDASYYDDYGNVSFYYGNSQSPSYQYFNNYVLRISGGLDHLGSLRGGLVGCLLLAWFICFCCVCKGVKSVGKVVYVTVLFPYILLLILLVRSVTLPGAINGIYYFILPDFNKLLKPEIWMLAAVQNFNSIGIGFGSLIAFSSYNRKNNNIYHDTLAIALVNSFTSLLAGFVVFSALGGIAETLGVSVADAARAGPELVFVVIPALFTHLPVPNLWAVLYFLMLICLGIDSQFATVEVINTGIVDHFREKLNNIPRLKELVALVVCVVCFLLGLPHVTEGGIYFFVLVDYYAAVIPLLYVAYFEVMAACWLYGGNRLAREISFLSGYRPYYFFPFCWVFLSPMLITSITNFSQYTHGSLQYGDYVYPVWAKLFGSLISLTSTIWVPVGIIHTLCTNKGTCKQRFIKAVTPTFYPEHMKRSNISTEATGTHIEMQPQYSPVAVTVPLLIEGADASAPPSTEVSTPSPEISTPPPDYDTAASKEYEALKSSN